MKTDRFEVGERAEVVYPHSGGESVHEVEIIRGPNGAGQHYVSIVQHNGSLGPPFFVWPLSALRKKGSK